MDIADIVYGNLILVTGKGGVGKTQVTAALGTLAAAQGRKTAIVEMGDQTPSMNRIFSADIGYEPSKVADNLWALNLDWAAALQEWIQRVVPIKRVVKLILENALVRRDLWRLEHAIQQVQNAEGRYPADEAALGRALQRLGDSTLRLDAEGRPLDHWGKRIRYRYPGQHVLNGFDLWSLGWNGEDDQGGPGDLTNWR